MSVPSGPCTTKRQAPPGRKSIWHTGSVHPLGPNQCGTCSGLVKASQTSLRGASKTRVMTISRSDGVVNVVAPKSVATAIIFLLFFQVLEIFVQSSEGLIPEAAIALGPNGDF